MDDLARRKSKSITVTWRVVGGGFCGLPSAVVTLKIKILLYPYISRIDDMVTPDLGDIFGACNYSLPIDFKYFSGLKGQLNLKIPAGSHKIEYLLLGTSVFDGLVQVDNYTFEAGKKYTITVEKKEKRETSYTVKFVEN
jgi:hypothetical protein